MAVNPDELIKPLNDAFDTVRKVISEIIDKFNAGVNHVNDWSLLLGPVMIPISHGLDAIKEGLTKLHQLIAYALQHQIPIVSLVYQSFKWIDGVQRPITGVYTQPGTAQMGTYHNEELSEWQGAAKTVYDGKVSEQSNAIDAMATKADAISKWLMEIAQANVEYMVQLASLATKFFGSITSAAIDAATVVELPFTVEKLSGAIGDLVTGGMNILLAVANRFMQTLGRIRDTSSWMNDKALPGGRWPQAVHVAGE